MCRRDSPLDTCGPFGVKNYIVFSQLYMVFHLSISKSLENGIRAKDTPSEGKWQLFIGRERQVFEFNDDGSDFDQTAGLKRNGGADLRAVHIGAVRTAEVFEMEAAAFRYDAGMMRGRLIVVNDKGVIDVAADEKRGLIDFNASASLQHDRRLHPPLLIL